MDHHDAEEPAREPTTQSGDGEKGMDDVGRRVGGAHQEQVGVRIKIKLQRHKRDRERRDRATSSATSREPATENFGCVPVPTTPGVSTPRGASRDEPQGPPPGALSPDSYGPYGHEAPETPKGTRNGNDQDRGPLPGMMPPCPLWATWT